MKFSVLAAALLSALPRLGIAAEVSSPAAGPSSFEDAPLQIDVKVEMELLQIRELAMDGVQRFLAVDPAVVSVRLLPGTQTLVLQALSLGLTYVHVWTAQGRRTVEVRVSPAVSKPQGDRGRSRGDSFRAEVSATANAGSTEYPDFDQEIRTRNQYYNLNLAGPTVMGRFRGDLRYENRNGLKDVASARVDVSNALGLWEAGDLLAPVSQITLPFIGFQGARYTSPQRKAAYVDLLGGYTNRKFWGDRHDIGRDQPDNPFGGVRAGVRPFSGADVFLVGSRSFSDDYPDRQRTRGAGAQWSNGALGFRGERAQSEGGAARYGDVQFRRPRGQALVAWRDVNPGYTTINGSAWARGERGVTAQAGVHDLGPVWFFDVRHDRFRTGYLPSRLNPGALNRDWTGQAVLRRDVTELRQDVLLQDFPGTFSSSRHRLYRTKLSQWKGPFQPNLFYRREWGVSLENRSLDYVETGRGTGYLFKPSNHLSHVLSVETVSARNLTTRERKSFVNVNAGLRLAGAPVRPDLKHMLSLEYREGSLRFADKTRSLFTQLRTDYLAGRDLEFYVLAQYERQVASASPRNTFEGFMGVQWRSDFGGPGTRARAVEGVVFKDLNGDGVQQPGEPGIPGARVLLNGDDEAVTKADGAFTFGQERGAVSLRLDLKGLPLGTRLSTSNPQSFGAAEDDRAIKVLFGLAYAGEITGKVYLDANGNASYDTGDAPVGRAVLVMDPGTGFERSRATDSQGWFAFWGVSPGSHQVQLNVLSLPSDVVLLTPSRLSMTLAEGQKRDLVFLVKPVRMMSGVVFWDKNGNGQREAGEPGVAGVTVRFVSQTAVTDKTGAYYLVDVKPGDGGLFVTQESLGRQWTIPDTFSMRFTVPKDAPFIRQNQDFPLKKRKS